MTKTPRPSAEAINSSWLGKADEALDWRWMAAGAPLPGAQLTLNLAISLRSSVMANFSLFAGFESLRVYHQVLTLPKSLSHPMSCQYCPALDTLATACPKVGPDAG